MNSQPYMLGQIDPAFLMTATVEGLQRRRTNIGEQGHAFCPSLNLPTAREVVSNTPSSSIKPAPFEYTPQTQEKDCQFKTTNGLQGSCDKVATLGGLNNRN